MLTLLELLNGYPGGIAALSARVEVSTHALYRFAAGKNRKRPTRLVMRVTEVLRSEGGMRIKEATVWEAWERAATARSARR